MGDEPLPVHASLPLVARIVEDHHMADIQLRPGGVTENRLPLQDGELTRVYGPKFLSRRAKRELTAAIEARQAFMVKMAELRRDELSAREEERYLRLTCDAISLLITGTKDDTPPAGDVLYRGWVEDGTVADHQIVGLFEDLLGVRSEPSEGDDSPS